MKRLGQLLMAGWVLWVLDLDDLNIIKVTRLWEYDTWDRCTYALIVTARNDTALSSPAAPRQPAAILQCLPNAFAPKTGSVK